MNLQHVLLPILFLFVVTVAFSQDTDSEPELYKVVHEMPRFPGCEDPTMTRPEKKSCAETKLMEYVQGNLVYPEVAKSEGIEGKVYLQFVVEVDGYLTDINVVRDIGGGCGETAKELVEGMNDMDDYWTPGRNNGEPVRVLYTMPVRFRLDEDKSSEP